MMKILNRSIFAILTLCGFAGFSYAQTQPVVNTTKILDTSVLFAIGAREAEQVLRGSFGWPTFQEGFVEDVYFRFDPDGYARFSISPRLDEDVFEVICAESSTACIAQKLSLRIGLTQNNAIHLQIDGISPNDRLFLSDRTNELPLPNSVLEPLDARLEALLAAGGDLIVKREVETIQVISLAGFSAVTTYLRWVAQGQDPRTFPHGWPVPAQFNTQTQDGWTQPDSWTSVNSGASTAQSAFAAQANLQNSGLQGVPTGNGAFQNFVGQRLQSNPIAVRQPVQTRQRLAPAAVFQHPMTQNQNQVLLSDITALRRELAALKAQQHSNVPQITPAGIAMHHARSHPQAPEIMRNPVSNTAAMNHDARFIALEQKIAYISQDILQLKAQLSQIPNAGATTPAPRETPQQKPNVDTVLEDLLLRRLAPQAPVTPYRDLSNPALSIPVTANSPSQYNPALPNTVSPSASPTGAHSVPNQLSTDADGFFNLAEYLNNVLRSE